MERRNAGDYLYLHRTEGGAWHYRRRAPRGLPEVVGRREFKLSLGDADEQTAIILARHINDKLEAYLAEVRRALRAAQEHPLPEGEEWRLPEVLHRLEKQLQGLDDEG